MPSSISRSTTSEGAPHVIVRVDWTPARLQGAEFFRVFERELEIEFRNLLILAVRVAQSFAPKGDRNYKIEDLDDAKRAGGSTRSTPGNPLGFAVTDSPKMKIRKVPGGTLRRTLSFSLITVTNDLLTGRIGVLPGSPAEAYARIAELGGTIRAKKAKYLRFAVDGETVVFKTQVYHPPHPYIMPTLLYIWPHFLRLPETAFQRTKEITGLI